MTLRKLSLIVALAIGWAAASVPASSVAVQAPPPAAAAPEVPLPNRADSLKFAVLGDFGTGDKPQYQVADQMVKLHGRFPFVLVTLVGDNLYGSQGERDYERKFELPYKALLSAGVKFYASLGNHDRLEQRFYKPFNMGEKRYYSFKAPKEDVRFFALESSYLNAEQTGWIESELRGSNEDWKIAFFHHPPYSSGDKHGSDEAIRETLEPLFIKYNVSVVLTGHDHFYERIKPQQGITYFVVGAGGKLRSGNIRAKSALTARGFDTDLSFLAAEIDGDEMFFNAISRAGRVVDSGLIRRRGAD
jgi:hypothetical protein